jgi:anti-sigma28 factor (negative regulator of flagellin synthesis)
VKKQQNNHKIIPLPLGTKKREIQKGNTDQGIDPTTKGITAGQCATKGFLRRSRRRREAMEVFRKTGGLRGDKIRALKERIGAGGYRVAPEAVAEKLLEHAICEAARGMLPTSISRSHQSHDQRQSPASL